MSTKHEDILESKEGKRKSDLKKSNKYLLFFKQGHLFTGTCAEFRGHF